MPIKSFRGLIADGAIDIVTLHTNDGATGYRIIKFQIMGIDPSATTQESLVKIYKVRQTSATTTQIQKASYTDNLSAEDKIILRGALYLFTIMDDKLSDDQKQGILKAAWILQVSKDASAETDKYLKAAWATIQNDGPELKKTYKQFGGKYKVLQRIKKGYVRTSGKGTQRHEITTYEWANR